MINPSLLHHLHAFAVNRLEAGIGMSYLSDFGPSIHASLRALSFGYLPEHYHDALDTPSQKAVDGIELGNRFLLPAYDENEQLVDCCIINPETLAISERSIYETSCGLCCLASLKQAEGQIIVTDSFVSLLRLLKQGYQDVIFIRNEQDVTNNIEQFVSNNIRQVTLRMEDESESKSIGNVFRNAGFFVTIENVSVTGADMVTIPKSKVVTPEINNKKSDLPQEEKIEKSNLTFTNFDEQDSIALFQSGPIRYCLETRDDGNPQRQVIIRRGDKAHRDRINLSVLVQRQRFAASASRRVSVEKVQIVEALAEAWAYLETHEKAIDTLPTVAIGESEKAEAETLLKNNNLLSELISDLSTLGWVGEETTKGLLYLTSISRLLPSPLWSVYQASAGAAPWHSLGLLAALTPPEDCVVFHTLTESLLRQTDKRSLRHKLLFIDRAETIRPEGALALRVLNERGSIGWHALASQENQQSAGLLTDVRGPVAVLAASAGALDKRCRDIFLKINVDESPEQTERIVSAQQNQHCGNGPTQNAIDTILKKHHAVQRLLKPLVVIIPFAKRIHFPKTSITHRQQHAALLTLIEASALLHQYQRERTEDGALIATEHDFTTALSLAGSLLSTGGDGLSSQARQLYERLFATSTTDFALADLKNIQPDWTYYAYRHATEELVHMGLVTASEKAMGRKRSYQLSAGTTNHKGDIYLKEGADVPPNSAQPFDLLKPFEGVSQGFDNLNLVTKVS